MGGGNEAGTGTRCGSKEVGGFSQNRWTGEINVISKFSPLPVEISRRLGVFTKNLIEPEVD